jgi:hypothetical protein
MFSLNEIKNNDDKRIALPPGFDANEISNKKELNQDSSKNNLKALSPIISIKNISDQSTYNMFSLNQKYVQKQECNVSSSEIIQQSKSPSGLGLGLELKIDLGIDNIIKQPQLLSKSIFILWDIDSAPLKPSDQIDSLQKNIDAYIANNIQEENLLNNFKTDIKQIIFLGDYEFRKSIGKNITTSQLDLLQNYYYKVKTHTKGGVENAMRGNSCI